MLNVCLVKNILVPNKKGEHVSYNVIFYSKDIT